MIKLQKQKVVTDNKDAGISTNNGKIDDNKLILLNEWIEST